MICVHHANLKALPPPKKKTTPHQENPGLFEWMIRPALYRGFPLNSDEKLQVATVGKQSFFFEGGLVGGRNLGITV